MYTYACVKSVGHLRLVLYHAGRMKSQTGDRADALTEKAEERERLPLKGFQRSWVDADRTRWRVSGCLGCVDVRRQRVLRGCVMRRSVISETIRLQIKRIHNLLTPGRCCCCCCYYCSGDSYLLFDYSDRAKSGIRLVDVIDSPVDTSCFTKVG